MATKKTSPKGVAIYPRLTTPDTKFDPDGVYKTQLALDKGVEENEKFIASIQEAYDAYIAEVTKENKGKAPRTNPPPYDDEVDEAGNPTGRYLVTFKAKASGTSRKTGKRWQRTIPQFDATGSSCNVDVWGGSTIKVAYELKGYKGGSNYGVKLYLEGVQIIDLVNGSNRSASSFGFGSEEGFTADDYEADEDIDEGAGSTDESSDTDGADF